MSSNQEGGNQARIMIWSPPRSLSTAFARSMSARGDTKVFWEPYMNCYNYGPERKGHWADDIPGVHNDKYTFDYVNSVMKQPHPDSKVLFAKCMIEPIVDDFGAVAPGYKHCFLMRHPLKMYRSYEKLFKNGVIPQDFKAAYRNIYHELEKFHAHVTNVLGQSAPPIIDADDLIAQPEAVLSKFCESIGIPFTPNMLRWESIDDPAVLGWEFMDVGVITQKKYTESLVLIKAFKATSFGGGAKEKTTNIEEYSSDVRECAEHAMPAYERLRNLRIKV